VYTEHVVYKSYASLLILLFEVSPPGESSSDRGSVIGRCQSELVLCDTVLDRRNVPSHDADNWFSLFLPCDAVCTVLVIVILSVRLSVRPSVCPSVTLVHCVHTVRPTTMISSPYGSPIILVSGISSSSQNSKGITPSEGVE